MKPNKNALTVLFVILVAASLILSGCAPKPTAAPTLKAPATLPPTNTAAKPTITVAPIPLPALTLHPGDFYFSVDGTQSMIFLRNPTGYTPEDFSLLLDWARQGGTKLLRIHLTVGWNTDIFPWSTTTGAVNETWAQEYDRLFDEAEADGIWIMPVFSAWFNWNDGAPDIGGADWQYNPYNQANGGPFAEPGEIFQPDSPAQQEYMEWVKTVVERWQGRNNIVGWEILSEINIASGAPGDTGVDGAVSEPMAEDFTNRMAAMIRATDTKHRPLTVSLAGSPGAGQTWAKFYDLEVLDFIEVHPYHAQLDREIIAQVHQNLSLHNKPVVIGESGFWGDNVAIQPNSWIGIRHAIWAGVISGAANARALWSEDGWAFYGGDRPLAVEYMEAYATAELPAARFTDGVDFSGFKPLTSTSSPAVWGAAVGNESMALGWYRDAASEPPDWTIQTIPAGQTVTITIPGTAANWQVDFYDTSTGTTILSSTSVTRQGSTVTVILPEFQDDIAFKMTAGAETSVITPEVTGNTNAIAGTWSGTITNDAGTFSTPLELSIQFDCEAGNLCGTFTVPQLPCSGDLFLNEITAADFIFIEQNSSGAAFCKSGGYEYLRLLEDGTLSYMYSSQSSGDSSTGILQRP
jgi:hypothetical protein